MIESGKYQLRNGRIVYYDEQQPRQVAMLVESSDGVRYGRSFPINTMGELFGATPYNYVVGDVIQVNLSVPYYKRGFYIITGLDAPFTVSLAKLTRRWFVPTTNTAFIFEIRYHVALGQRPFLPYPHVPVCPDCTREGRGIAESPLYLKSAPGGEPLYVCEQCRFCGKLD